MMSHWLDEPNPALPMANSPRQCLGDLIKSDSVEIWLNEPNPAFGDKPPIENRELLEKMIWQLFSGVSS